jgi:uncharacterized protein (DUF1778 family)
MPRNKNKTLSIRTTAEIKDLLRQAAERERRSVTAMVEALVLNYVQRHELKQTVAASIRKTNKK